MSLNNPVMGEGYVPAYQISAAPYVTSSNITLGSTREINFDFVTRFFTIKNTGASTNVISVGFTQNGLLPEKSNFYPLSGSEVLDVEIRTSKIFISGSAGASVPFSLIAGLTNIPVKNFLTITGSNGYLGVG